MNILNKSKNQSSAETYSHLKWNAKNYYLL